MQPGAAMPSSVSVATAEIVAQQSQDYVDEQLAEYQNQIQQLQGRTIERNKASLLRFGKNDYCLNVWISRTRSS